MHGTSSVQAPGRLPLPANSVPRIAARLRRSALSSNLLRGGSAIRPLLLQMVRKPPAAGPSALFSDPHLSKAAVTRPNSHNEILRRGTYAPLARHTR